MAVRNPNARNSDELVFNYKKGQLAIIAKTTTMRGKI